MFSPIVELLQKVTSFLGSTIAGGYILALSLICLLQYIVHLHRIRLSSQKNLHLQQQTEHLAQELREAQRVSSIQKLENQLLQEIISNTEHGSTIDLLLRRLVPDEKRGFCVFLNQTENKTNIIHSRGLCNTSLDSLQINSELYQRVQSQRIVILERVRLYESPLMAKLAPVDRKKTRQLVLLAVGDPKDPTGIIITTSLYPTGIPRDRQIDLTHRIMRSIGSNLKHTQELEMQENLLRTTSEMLELRMIADQQYATPLPMIENFLNRLSEQINFDRSALFLATRNAGALSKALARTGPLLQGNLLSYWNDHEDLLADIGMIQTKPLFFNQDELKDLGIDTLIGRAFVVPLVLKTQTTGVLCLTDTGTQPLHDSEHQLILWAVEYLAETIHRALNQAAVERQARQDGLTKLANRQTFDDTIRDVLDQSKQTGSNCSLLLLDLDHFKSINDTYGHQMGDEVLRSTAEIIQQQVQDLHSKDQALVARYGGEEIALLLPGIGIAKAINIGESIRQAVESLDFSSKKQQFKVTASLGVATFPVHAETVNDLIAKADQALYQAKRLGRNRVDSPEEKKLI